MAAKDELDDIQALVRSGFGSLGGARYLLLRAEDPITAKAWLRTLDVAPASCIGRGKEVTRVVQLAFTHSGLRRLGFSEDALSAFVPEYIDGMAGNERRSHRLGDVGANAPAHWAWGVGEKEPHILVILLAKKTDIAAWATEIEQDAVGQGCSVISVFDCCPGREDGSLSQEPFGFADGMSQPAIDWDSKVAVTGAVNRDYRPEVAAGEVLLGHRNEYGFIADYPQNEGLGYNGSYLVYRQLRQDVTGFWQWAAATVGTEKAVWFAEQLVGRSINGDPLPGLSPAGPDFLFRNDGEGRHCPLGSHIRRANPRAGDDPQGRRGFLRDIISSVGLAGTAQEDAVASSRFHRLLRRGRSYGELIPPTRALDPAIPPVEAGLHFLCLNASLARQFEFVQGAWLGSATFGGQSGAQDPLLGNRQPFPAGKRTDLFRYRDADGCPAIAADMPQFVQTIGGAYFFLPGLRGLAVITGNGGG
jgi:deferrochelatase/peroxidase EfeB